MKLELFVKEVKMKNFFIILAALLCNSALANLELKYTDGDKPTWNYKLIFRDSNGSKEQRGTLQLGDSITVIEGEIPNNFVGIEDVDDNVSWDMTAYTEYHKDEPEVRFSVSKRVHNDEPGFDLQISNSKKNAVDPLHFWTPFSMLAAPAPVAPPAPALKGTQKMAQGDQQSSMLTDLQQAFDQDFANIKNETGSKTKSRVQEVLLKSSGKASQAWKKTLKEYNELYIKLRAGLEKDLSKLSKQFAALKNLVTA